MPGDSRSQLSSKPRFKTGHLNQQSTCLSSANCHDRATCTTLKGSQGCLASSDGQVLVSVVHHFQSSTGHATQQAHIPPLPYYHTCLATENMPAATWLHKRSHTTLGPPAYLLPALANTCQTYNCTISPIFTLGASHTISKFLSRSFHLDDDIILQHMQSMVPVHLPWKLVTPPVHITSFMNLALLRKMQPEPSL